MISALVDTCRQRITFMERPAHRFARRRRFALGRFICFAALVCSTSGIAAADLIVPLWPELKVDPAMGEERVTERSKTGKPDRSFGNVTKPTLTAVLPDKPTGAAVIICPG